jgi:hypothetical protein
MYIFTEKCARVSWLRSYMSEFWQLHRVLAYVETQWAYIETQLIYPLVPSRF